MEIIMYADNGADSRGVNKVLHSWRHRYLIFNYVPLNISWDKQRHIRSHKGLQGLTCIEMLINVDL